MHLNSTLQQFMSEMRGRFLVGLTDNEVILNYHSMSYIGIIVQCMVLYSDFGTYTAVSCDYLCGVGLSSFSISVFVTGTSILG